MGRISGNSWGWVGQEQHPDELEDLASDDTESGPAPSGPPHSHLCLGGLRGHRSYCTYSVCQAWCTVSLTLHTSPRCGDGPTLQMRKLRQSQSHLAGRRHAWGLNQVQELPKPYSVLSCEIVSAVLGLGWGWGVCTKLVDQVRGNLRCVTDIIDISQDDSAISSVA